MVTHGIRMTVPIINSRQYRSRVLYHEFHRSRLTHLPVLYDILCGQQTEVHCQLVTQWEIPSRRYFVKDWLRNSTQIKEALDITRVMLPCGVISLIMKVSQKKLITFWRTFKRSFNSIFCKTLIILFSSHLLSLHGSMPSMWSILNTCSLSQAVHTSLWADYWVRV